MADKQIKADTGFSLKDALFNVDSVSKLAGNIARVHAPFRKTAFVKDAMRAFPQLELKARIDCLVSLLGDYLPADLEGSLEILEASLPAVLDPTLTDDDFGEYIWIVPGEYAARFGCNTRHLKRSLNFLRSSTKRFSAENAIRPFLAGFPRPALKFIRACAEDDNYHVRRLASEGTRPLLPWSMRLALPVSEVIPILDTLHQDETRYVTRSVANHLNDLSRQDPAVVLDSLDRWQRMQLQQDRELNWIAQHSLRTLVRQDHLGALRLLGYGTEPDVKLSRLKASKSVQVGDSLNVSFDLQSRTKQKLLVALKVYFRKANGHLKPKVFKVRDFGAEAGEVTSFKKNHPIRPMTTRALYPGTHRLEVLVNGVIFGRSTFELEA